MFRSHFKVLVLGQGQEGRSCNFAGVACLFRRFHNQPTKRLAPKAILKWLPRRTTSPCPAPRFIKTSGLTSWTSSRSALSPWTHPCMSPRTTARWKPCWVCGRIRRWGAAAGRFSAVTGATRPAPAATRNHWAPKFSTSNCRTTKRTLTSSPGWRRPFMTGTEIWSAIWWPCRTAFP